MQAIGILMIEHRVIERMLKIMKNAFSAPNKNNEVNVALIDKIITFIRYYADKNHHGKEEDILFKALAQKDLSIEHQRIMNELLTEHVHGRHLLHNLEIAKERHVNGDQLACLDILANIKALLDLYPKHIEKEDEHFFIPSMDYFNDVEKEDLLKQCLAFDHKLDHQKYIDIIEELKSQQQARRNHDKLL